MRPSSHLGRLSSLMVNRGTIRIIQTTRKVPGSIRTSIRMGVERPTSKPMKKACTSTDPPLRTTATMTNLRSTCLGTVRGPSSPKHSARVAVNRIRVPTRMLFSGADRAFITAKLRAWTSRATVRRTAKSAQIIYWLEGSKMISGLHTGPSWNERWTMPLCLR